MTGWASPPVDDVGYISSKELLERSDTALKDLMARMRTARYEGWRNYEGRWRDVMGLDIGGRDVLDFGCGTGMEALELAKAGNRVTVADIEHDNVVLAWNILRIHGYSAKWRVLDQEPPYFPDGAFDTFHCSGVLHHIREPVPVMERAAQLLKPGGEARLMLYSDTGWRIATGTEPPEDVTASPCFMKFVRFFDAVGDYADWYNCARLHERFGKWFDIERCVYLTPDDRYLGAVLRKK